MSNDKEAVEQLSGSSQRFALSLEPCPNVPSALERLKRAKFEAVVVDFRLGSEAGAIMEGARKSPSNAHAVVLTISDGESEAAQAFKAGSTFLLPRPLSPASVDLGLKAAYGLIVREIRRYFRCPVEVPVRIQGRGIPNCEGHTVNVSEGGMLIGVAVGSFRAGDEVRAEFSLPGGESQFGLDALVCWAKPKELRLGLQFTANAAQQIPNLQEWLSRRLEESLPQSVWTKISHFVQY